MNARSQGELVNDEVWLQVGACRLRLIAERHPEGVPWKFLTFKSSLKPLRRTTMPIAHGAMGLNPQDLALLRVSSNGSSTTNQLPR